jgi:hypothetical protein
MPFLHQTAWNDYDYDYDYVYELLEEKNTTAFTCFRLGAHKEVQIHNFVWDRYRFELI